MPNIVGRNIYTYTLYIYREREIMIGAQRDTLSSETSGPFRGGEGRGRWRSLGEESSQGLGS